MKTGYFILLFKRFLFAALFLMLIFSSKAVFCQTGIADSTRQQIIADSISKSIPWTPIADLIEKDTITVANHKNETLQPPELGDIISISNIIWTLIFLFVGYFLIKLAISLLNNIARRNPGYDFTIKRIIPIVRIFSWILLIYIIIIGIFSPPASTIFAFLASAGVAVGFAAQDLLKNVFGGFVVMFDRPFQIGDKIASGDYYGEVVEIGIRSTKVVTPDDSVVTIPNSEFMMQYVSNSNSGANNCQVVAEIYLPLNVDTARVRQIAIEAAQVSKYIYLNKPIVVVFFNEFKERSSVIKMRIKAYVSDLEKEFVFKSEMTELVIKELIKENIIKQDFFLN